MKELFLKVWHCVPLPAAAKPLAVSELPPAACQQQGLSFRIGKLSKSKNIKNIVYCLRFKGNHNFSFFI